MDDKASGIHPAPIEFSNTEIAQDPILQFFHYAHLPPKLRGVSVQFCQLAMHIINQLPRNAERTVALRKLLEAKDAAVRANLPVPGFSPSKPAVASTPELGEPQEIINADDDRDGPLEFQH